MGNLRARIVISGVNSVHFLAANYTQWKILDLAEQLHGRAGRIQGYPICRMFTDARINQILAGSSEIMKFIISCDALSDNYTSMLD
ncbi:MAG: acyl-CoA dehydrogenase family protein [Oceanicoccus sp.]